jgi:sorbose reductase
MDVNVNGSFLFAREVGKYMIDEGIKGSIIMVASMSGVIVNRPQKQSAYNAVSASLFLLSPPKLTFIISQKQQ